MATITFEFYGRLERLAQQSAFALEIVTPSNVEDALKLLASNKPDLSENLERCACAIGDALISRSHILEGDATLALLPPVAGG